MLNELLDKINKLYKKQVTEGLTEEEKQQQAELRKEYIKIFRNNFKAQLDTIKVVDSEEYNEQTKKGFKN
jgi:uncharacterized protein YnzC (UPF0291/DUF896 family)